MGNLATPPPAGRASVAILTRPAGQNAALASRLAARGWRVLDLPALQLVPVDGVPPDPAGFDLAVFVSGNAVRMFLDQARREFGPGWAWPSRVPAAVVGPSSAAALRAHAAFGAAPAVLQPPADSPQFDSEALWQVLSARALPARVLIVRGGLGEQGGARGSGRDWLANRLRLAGAALVQHRAYRRQPAPWAPDRLGAVAELAARGQRATWLLTSAEGVDAVLGHLKMHGLVPWWAGCRLVATHPRIAQHLISVMADALPGHGWISMLQTCAPRDEEILAAIESLS